MTTTHFSRTLSTLAVAFMTVTAVGLLSPQTSHGQIWQQTARLRAPVYGGPLETLLDSLVQSLERRDGATVQRFPGDRNRLSVSALQDTLIEKHGIGIITANTLFIDYLFELGVNGELDRRITGLEFHLLPGPIQEEIPILYIDAREPWVQKLLNTEGTTLETNQAAIIPFRRHLQFVSLARSDETYLVEIGGETVREGFSVKKESLLRQIEELTYNF